MPGRIVRLIRSSGACSSSEGAWDKDHPRGGDTQMVDVGLGGGRSTGDVQVLNAMATSHCVADWVRRGARAESFDIRVRTIRIAGRSHEVTVDA